MCNKSETISKIAAAMVAFSGEVKTIEKDGTNPHFQSSYTTLDHMIDETKPLLHKHGLTVMQFPGGDGERITVRTMILHTSGEWIESEPFTLKAVKVDPQGAGSATTYARRYSYAAALSLSLGDDDDGNAASHAPQGQQSNVQSRNGNTPNRQNGAANSQPNGSGGSVMSRVYKLREELQWEWNDLNQFAADTLGRPIKFLKSDVKDQAEWLKIEQAMIATRDGINQQPYEQDDLPF